MYRINLSTRPDCDLAENSAPRGENFVVVVVVVDYDNSTPETIEIRKSNFYFDLMRLFIGPPHRNRKKHELTIKRTPLRHRK